MIGKLGAVSVAFALLSIFLALQALQPSHHSNHKYDAKNKLRSSQVIRIIGAVGPESLAFDPNGEGPYTGVSDGRILKWQGKDGGWAEFAFTSPHYLDTRDKCEGGDNPEMERVCGRPLGLRFHQRTGDLYIADAFYGLMVVGPTGGHATQLASQAHFTNDVEIDHDAGAVYFTESSTRFERRHFISLVLSGDKTGKLMEYNMETKKMTVLLDSLSFPNGIALSNDASFLLIAETSNCRILRYWLRTPKAGTTEVFAQLPGFPDNIRRTAGGDFWVALHSKRSKILESFMRVSPLVDSWFRQLGSNIDDVYPFFADLRPRTAMAVRLSKEGEVLEALEDRGGKVLRVISEVGERNGSLWIGSVIMPHVGLLKL